MKILIIRFSSIGDIVLTTPVIRCLHRQLGAEVHCLTKQSFRGIVDPNPYVGKVFAIEKEVTEVLADLKKEQYDLIVDLHHNLRSARVKFVLGAKSRSFDKINLQKWLIVNLKVDRLPRVHIVDRYLATVAHLGVKNDGEGLDYFIPEADEVIFDRAEAAGRWETIVSNGQYAVFQGRPAYADPDGYRDSGRGEQPAFAEASAGEASYTAFVIGAAHATKRLPTGKIISLCKGIKEPVVLLGGPGEAEEGRQIAAAAGPHVLNTCGVLRLHQSADLVKQARRVISHDTGLMHVAAAFRKEILSVWGNTIPEFGMYPYYPAAMDRNVTFEVKGLPCRPCSKIGYQKCPKGHFRCMRDQEEASILDALSSDF